MHGKVIPVAIALASLAGLGGCTTLADQAEAVSVSDSVASFTCCRAADVDPVRHPGETFPIHWIMNLAPTPKDAPTQQIVLHVELSGGHHSDEQLKNAEATGSSVTARAGSITTSSTATTAPVTEITIPETAQPGLYNLTFSVDTDGAVLSGSTIIHVEAADDST